MPHYTGCREYLRVLVFKLKFGIGSKPIDLACAVEIAHESALTVYAVYAFIQLPLIILFSLKFVFGILECRW